jgi:hypothetical protein
VEAIPRPYQIVYYRTFYLANIVTASTTGRRQACGTLRAVSNLDTP